MRVYVDPDSCRQHGQCEIAAPDVFELRHPGGLTYDQQPDESRWEDVEYAVDACPEQAISLVDDAVAIPDAERWVEV